MAHLVNRDIWPMLLLRIGSGGLAWQKWGLFIAMVTMSFDWIGSRFSSSSSAGKKKIAIFYVSDISTYETDLAA
jgi:hypothetical protein